MIQLDNAHTVVRVYLNLHVAGVHHIKVSVLINRNTPQVIRAFDVNLYNLVVKGLVDGEQHIEIAVDSHIPLVLIVVN